MFVEYIVLTHKNDLLKILRDSCAYNNFSVNVDFLKLFEADPIVGDDILCNPKNTLKRCNEDLSKAQKSIFDNQDAEIQRGLSIKKNVFARFFGLPVCPELHRTTIPKNKDLGCFLKVTGTAIRITQSKMLEYQKTYKCLKCQYVHLVEGKYEHRYVIKCPAKCRNPDIRCSSTTLSPVNVITRENCKDYQEMKIQEQVNKLSVGGIPGSIWVTLEDDLVDCCKPGDDVSICGTVTRRWNPIATNKKCDVDLVFKANYIEVCNAQKSIAVSVAPDIKQDFDEFWSEYDKCPMRGRDVILASVCPQVYGMYMVKLALTLTVITGSGHSLEATNDSTTVLSTSPEGEKNKSSIRGQCHLLLVGDPGTGKSQLLKAGALLTTRSVLTSGSGSTKAGLTCTALREDGEWQLEAGALVLADGGACCIDELTQMREHDRASIHEAMEQQTISVAKAGIICKLNTRCAVIAACNPKGHYDIDQPLSINVSLGTPLLSRFDLIFILLDTQNYQWDKLVSDYILFGKMSNTPNPKNWPLEKIQVYLSLIGPYEVSMSRNATTILRAYYVRQRMSEHRDPSRTTVRMLDSLVRLSQAHARLMYRHVTLTIDAVTVVTLMDLSMQDCTLSDTSDALHSTFSECPDFNYLKVARILLTSLNLVEIWQEELTFYGNLMQVDTQQLESDIDSENMKRFCFDDSKDNRNDENVEVIESSYFKASTSNHLKRAIKDNLGNCNSQNLFEDDIEKEEEIDLILSLDDDHGKCKYNDKIDDFVNKIFSPENDKKLHSTNMLAKTLKKHSNLNSNGKLNTIGIITGKRKRETRKNNKSKLPEPKRLKKNPSKKTKKEDTDVLQDVLNELKGNKDKRVCYKNKKTKSNVSKHIEGNDSNSEDEIDDINMLKCLPSVNDAFNDISKFFNLSNSEDEKSVFEDSQLVLDEKCVKVAKDSTKIKEDVQENIKNTLSQRVADEFNTSNSEKETEIFDKCTDITSPVNTTTLEKLNKFSFHARADKDCSNSKKQEDTSFHVDKPKFKISSIDDSKLQLKKQDEKIIANSNKKEYETNFKNNLNNNLPSSLGPSQTSIFENDDDDYDALDM